MTRQKYPKILVEIIFLSIFLIGVAFAGNVGSVHEQSLKGPFQNGISVTKACLDCHEQQGKEILDSAHWHWQGKSLYLEGHESKTNLGKKNMINNF
ncbi:MAG: hypothetical protein R6U27_03355 [Desulfobacterales bacterium]